MNSSLETFVPLQFKRKKGKLLVDGRESAHDARIIEAVARAMYWHDLLDSGMGLEQVSTDVNPSLHPMPDT